MSYNSTSCPVQAASFIATACKPVKLAATRCDFRQQEISQRDWLRLIAIPRDSVSRSFNQYRWLSHRCMECRPRSASCGRFQRKTARPTKKNAPFENTLGLQNR